MCVHNVGKYRDATLIFLTLGPHQSRYARLLQRQWMLYPQAVVIQYLGGDSRSVTNRISVHVRVSHVDQIGLTKKSRKWMSRIHTFQCLCRQRYWSAKRIISKASLRKLHGLPERKSVCIHYIHFRLTSCSFPEEIRTSKSRLQFVQPLRLPCILVCSASHLSEILMNSLYTRLRKMDQESSRFAAEIESMEQCRSMGVQKSA
jgi:hypothetical protein